ncbi:Rhodanese-like domain [Macleaya cordata]|uniref:Rhodanese-like domain n=1 Tax=Macleaya cordata TaxID=56857 RepID=A0A200RA76_MACCD|nr:Rhodanese-like domain [Macleaya cordata]
MDAPKSSGEIVTVDVHAAKDLLHSSGFRYLDVRTNEEFNKSHVENAVNVPYMFITPEGKVKNPEFLDQISSLCSKDDQLVVGCNSGGRSLRACADLLEAGYVNIRNMGGGYSAWVDNGLAAGNDKPTDEMKTACKFRP